MTFGQLYKYISEKLRQSNVESYSLDAREIILTAAAMPREKFRLCFDIEANKTICKWAKSLCDERAKRVPLQYVLGEWDFFGLNLKMERGVFIPRPETEGLVQLVLDFVAEKKSARGLEIGIGSGAISLALINHKHNISMFSNDISYFALNLSYQNAVSLNISNRLNLFQSSFFDAIGDERFDFIVSNPPYIDPAMADSLEPELGYEPQNALYSGDRGREAPRKIIDDSWAHLKEDGAIFLEIAEYNIDYFKDYCCGIQKSCKVFPDLFNKPRFLMIQEKLSFF